MSRQYGKAIQAGYLVDALEPAMRYWSEQMGIGPFFVLPAPRFLSLTHNGQPTEARDVIAEVALAQSGDLQIELIVPGPAPSTYRDFLASGGRGLHHLGFASHDFDAQRDRAIAAGLVSVMEGASDRTRFAYLDSASPAPGPIVELIEMGPAITAIFDQVRAASADWDGTDPIRSV